MIENLYNEAGEHAYKYEGHGVIREVLPDEGEYLDDYKNNIIYKRDGKLYLRVDGGKDIQISIGDYIITDTDGKISVADPNYIKNLFNPTRLVYDGPVLDKLLEEKDPSYIIKIRDFENIIEKLNNSMEILQERMDSINSGEIKETPSIQANLDKLENEYNAKSKDYEKIIDNLNSRIESLEERLHLLIVNK